MKFTHRRPTDQPARVPSDSVLAEWRIPDSQGTPHSCKPSSSWERGLAGHSEDLPELPSAAGIYLGGILSIRPTPRATARFSLGFLGDLVQPRFVGDVGNLTSGV